MLWGPQGKTLGGGNHGQEPSVASSERNGKGGKVGNLNNLGGPWGIKVSLIVRYLVFITGAGGWWSQSLGCGFV